LEPAQALHVKATWVINFAANATPAQRTAAQNAVTAFNYVTAKAADDAEVAQLTTDLNAIKAIPALTALVRMSPAQIDTWATANITTVATARDAIATLAKVVAVLARQVV
jgi:hypothetical protein